MPERILECIVRINMKDKGPQTIEVYEGDQVNDLANNFMTKHEITDKEK